MKIQATVSCGTLQFAAVQTIKSERKNKFRISYFQNNFLDEFPRVSKAKSKKNKVQKAYESLWLDLLVNLSFSTDGQNMILKTTGNHFIRKLFL